jgi:hypothetical protein
MPQTQHLWRIEGELRTVTSLTSDQRNVHRLSRKTLHARLYRGIDTYEELFTFKHDAGIRRPAPPPVRSPESSIRGNPAPKPRGSWHHILLTPMEK